MACRQKSNCPPKCSIVLLISAVRSSTLVASAGIIGAPIFSPRALTSPIRMEIGVFVNTISAPSSWARSATFHAIDCGLSAPKISPFFPFNRLYAIVSIFLFAFLLLFLIG